MKLLPILLTLALLLCGSGIVSAADNSSNSNAICGIVDMGEVVKSGGTFWEDINKNGGAGYLLLSIGLLIWIGVIIYAAFGGSASYAIGGNTNNADTTKKGTDQLKRVAVAIVAPPLLLILLGIFAGLI